jgi:Aminoglycoside-2''-adenylyltransferase
MSSTHLLPTKVALLMRDFKSSWGIAGGWAIDLYLGRVTRTHADIEIAILRRDQSALREYLSGWRWQKAFNAELSLWQGERLDWPVHELYCINERAEPQQLEVLLNEAQGEQWVFRRNDEVKRPIAKCYLTTATGVNFLAPEIVLLYKSKAPRAQDEQDFAAVCARLDAERRAWLRAAVTICNAKHHWLNKL